jgi:TRAP-type C4-dicarboxylate transport system permease small subunit
MRIPYLYVYAAMPIGFVLLILHLLLIARRFVMAGDYKRTDDAEASANPIPGGANG